MPTEKTKVKGTKVVIEQTEWPDVLASADEHWREVCDEYGSEATKLNIYWLALSEAYELLGKQPLTLTTVTVKIKRSNLEALKEKANTKIVNWLLQCHEDTKWEIVGHIFESDNGAYYDTELSSAPYKAQLVLNETADVKHGLTVFKDLIKTKAARPLSFVKETSTDGLRADQRIVSSLKEVATSGLPDGVRSIIVNDEPWNEPSIEELLDRLDPFHSEDDEE